MAVALVRITPHNHLESGDVVVVREDGHVFSVAESYNCVTVQLSNDHNTWDYLYQPLFERENQSNTGIVIQKRKWKLIETAPDVWIPIVKPDPRNP